MITVYFRAQIPYLNPIALADELQQQQIRLLQADMIPLTELRSNPVLAAEMSTDEVEGIFAVPLRSPVDPVDVEQTHLLINALIKKFAEQDTADVYDDPDA